MAENRRKDILQILRKKKFQSVSDLSKQLFVSEATIRRDLNSLEKNNEIKRTTGGAFLLDHSKVERPLLLTNRDNADAKKMIADLAIDFISEDQTLFLDSSSTCFLLAKQLNFFKHLTVVTNGLLTAHMLSEETSSKIFCTGGEVYSKRSSTNGYHALRFIAEHNSDLCFVSCKGIAENGITDITESEALIKKEYHKKSAKTIVLADHSKFNKIYFCEALSFDQIDIIISNKKLPANLFEKAETLGIELIYPQ